MCIVTRLRKGLALLALSTVCAAADEATGPAAIKGIELPAHRALERIRTKEENAPAPFTTDGCSGGLSSAWTIVADRFPTFAEVHGATPPWEECCVIHDRAYHAAGPDSDPETSFATRITADAALRNCVIETGESRMSDIAALYEVDEESIGEAYRAIADAMHLAVRFGGAPCSGLPWRWGYGYPNCFVTPRDLSD